MTYYIRKNSQIDMKCRVVLNLIITNINNKLKNKKQNYGLFKF